MQDFNLVCDRKSWKNVAQMVYFFGLIFGVFGAGLLSDKFGRKATLGPIGIALGTVGLVTAAMPSVEAFVAIRGPIQWNTFFCLDFSLINHFSLGLRFPTLRREKRRSS